MCLGIWENAWSLGPDTRLLGNRLPLITIVVGSGTSGIIRREVRLGRSFGELARELLLYMGIIWCWRGCVVRFGCHQCGKWREAGSAKVGRKLCCGCAGGH